MLHAMPVIQFKTNAARNDSKKHPITDISSYTISMTEKKSHEKI